MVPELRGCYKNGVRGKGVNIITVCNASANSSEAVKFQNSIFSPFSGGGKGGEWQHAPRAALYRAALRGAKIWNFQIRTLLAN